MVFLPRMVFLISTAKSRNLTSLQGSAQMLPLPHSLPWYPLLKLMSILLLWALIGTVLTLSCHVVLFICVSISAPWGTCGRVPLPYTIYSLPQSSELLHQSHSSHLIDVIEYHTLLWLNICLLNREWSFIPSAEQMAGTQWTLAEGMNEWIKGSVNPLFVSYSAQHIVDPHYFSKDKFIMCNGFTNTNVSGHQMGNQHGWEGLGIIQYEKPSTVANYKRSVFLF